MSQLSSTPRQEKIRVENELHALFKRQHEFKRRSYPEWATYDGDHRFDDQLTDLSEEAAASRNHKNRQFLNELRALPREVLEPADQINFDLFELMLHQEIQAYEFGFHYLQIDQQEGIHLTFPQLVEIQPLSTFEQYERYFARLRDFARQAQDTIENLKIGLQHGIVLPQAVMGQTLEQLAYFRDLPLEEMPLYQPFRLNASQLSEPVQAKVREVIRTIIETVIRPHYAQLHDFVRDHYAPACHQGPGLWALADGEARYQALIDKYTCPGLTAAEIHQIGLAEVERIAAEMARVRQQCGFQADDAAGFHAFLRHAPRFYYTDKQRMLSDYQAFMQQVETRLPELFGRLPQSPWELREIEEYRAAAAPQAYYYPPPMDRSRPGIYYVNTFDLPSRPNYTMAALSLHEAVPGHHLQLALAQELKNLPDFRYHLDCTAFIEGWALYSESLGHEMGFYTDPYAHYGALSFEIWRACRLVVDTGLHALRWSRQQAFDFMSRYSANSELDTWSEIDRYLVLPGQALSYKMGEIQIWKLRREAEQRLGERFSLRQFHDALLQQGSIPLDLMNQQMQHWMQHA
jgi:uncharacterized protein (DUF885 family)